MTQVISKKLLKKKNHISYVKSEREILTKLRHPFVVQLHFAFQSEKKLFMVQYYCINYWLYDTLGDEFFERWGAISPDSQTRSYAREGRALLLYRLYVMVNRRRDFTWRRCFLRSALL